MPAGLPGVSGDLPLGKRVAYPRGREPSVLRGIERAPARAAIGVGEPLPFAGEDVWNGYELTWLAPSGLPRIGVVTVRVPCDSPRIVESKSLKLYLGGFAQAAFVQQDDVSAAIAADLAAVVGAEVSVDIKAPAEMSSLTDFRGYCLDDLPICVTHYQTTSDLLEVDGASGSGADAVYTHLFRSVCPVTGQPDHGSIRLAWRGRPLRRAGLLAYLVSYRDSAGFHEDTVERIFVDVQRAAAATELSVEGRFLRRGGIDINPWRGTSPRPPEAIRLARQ